MESSATTATPMAPPVRSLYAWVVVGVLCVASIVSFIDRQIINLLVEPIKADFGVSDTQIGLLQGFSFVLFYAVLAIPLARLTDGGNRKWMIIYGVICWTFATFSCGLAGSFAMLFVARMFVGVGEATLTPASYSLIPDYFARDRVGLAISVYTSASFAGSGIAYIFGGAMIEFLTALGPVSLPVVGERSVWQLTFFAVSVPSILVLALLAFVREPPRQETVSEMSGANAAFSAVIAHFLRHARLFSGVMFGLTLMAAAVFALNLWVPTLFIRVHGWTPMQIGSAFGTMVALGSTGGVFLGGAVASAWMKRGRDDAFLRVPIIACLCAVPFAVAFALVDNPTLSLLLVFPVLALSAVPFGCGTAVLPIISPNRLRAQVVAVYLLVVNLLSFTCGPTAVGLLTDYVFRDEMLVGYSLAIAPALFLIVGCALVSVALGPYARLVRAQA
jgi:MFS family permease